MTKMYLIVNALRNATKNDIYRKTKKGKWWKSKKYQKMLEISSWSANSFEGETELHFQVSDLSLDLGKPLKEICFKL